MGGDPAGNADNQAVKILALQGIHCLLDVLFLIVIGDGIDLDQIQACLLQRLCSGATLLDNNVDGGVDFTEANKCYFCHSCIPPIVHIFMRILYFISTP